MRISVCERGTDAAGLMRYLYGTGKVDEHTNQHMVAGSEGLVMEWGGALSKQEATQLGRLVEAPWRHQYADQLAVAGVGSGGVSRSNLTGESAGKGGESRHVYHVAMALSPDDAALSDEQWAQVASDYIDEMGFSDGGPGVGAKWAAVRHGLTANGGDHVHLVVELVRQDGVLCNTRNDWPAAVRIGDALEHKYDFLRVTKDAAAEQGPAVPGYTPAEARRAKERVRSATGPREPDRVHLQRVVRGAAQVASTEAEWVGAVLDADVDIEPRWAAGGRGRVVGYSVALDAPDASGEVVRYGGSKLASDLTLAKLRAQWAGSETDGSRAEAAALWRGDGDMSPRRPEAGTAELTAATEKLSEWNDRLETMDCTDRAAWKREAAHAAGTISLVASRVDPVRSQQLGMVADSLVRSAPPQGPVLSGLSDGELVARHLNLALRASGLDSGRGWAAVIQQMSRTTRAIGQAHEARGELAAAQRLLASAPVLDAVAGTARPARVSVDNPAENDAALHGQPDRWASLARRGTARTADRPARPAQHDRQQGREEDLGR